MECVAVPHGTACSLLTYHPEVLVNMLSIHKCFFHTYNSEEVGHVPTLRPHFDLKPRLSLLYNTRCVI